MKYLLDTHVFIWILEDNPRLKPVIRTTLANRENEFFMSAESLREMAIKVRIGKLQLPGPFDKVIEAERRKQKIKLLPVTIAHIKRLSTFTAKAGHNDPSDHIIICQALVEKMTLISADENFPAYQSMGLLLLMN